MSTSIAPQTTVPLDASLVIGPIVVAAIFNSLFTGCFLVQVYIYFTRYPEDKWAFKSVVIGLIVLELIKFGAELGAIWDITVGVMEKGPSVLIDSSTSMRMVSFLTPLIECIVQCFFLFRLWKISRALFPTLVGVLLLLTGQVSGFFCVARDLVIVNEIVMESDHMTRIILIMAFGTRVACDVWTSGFVVVYLWSCRDKTGLKTTRNVIDKLILWTIETGVCTSIVAAVTLATYITYGSMNYVWMAPFGVIGSVYANVLLAAMNGRWIIQRQFAGAHVYKIGQD